MVIDQLVFRLFSYIGYFWKAQSNLYIHSPFIYNWVNAIDLELHLKNSIIHQYREKLKEDNTPFIYYSQNKEVSVTVSKRYLSTSISDYYGKIIATTCHYLESKNFLELGTSLGVSTAYIMISKQLIKGVSIDSNIHATSKACNMFKQFYPNSKVIFRNGLFNDVLPNVLLSEDKFDFVFIDGDHNYTSIIDYVNKIRSFLSENSVIVLDDIRWSRGMFRAWQELIKCNEFNYTVDFGRIGLLFKISNHSPKQHFYLH